MLDKLLNYFVYVAYEQLKNGIVNKIKVKLQKRDRFEYNMPVYGKKKTIKYTNI